MASELYVETLKGLTSGANANKVIIPSGQTLYAPGHVIQVVQVIKTDTFASAGDSTFVDITGLSASITPTSTSSKILVTVDVNVGGANTLGTGLRLLRDTTPIGVGDSAGSRKQTNIYTRSSESPNIENMGISFLDSPSTTSSVTYKMQGYSDSGGPYPFYINRSLDDTDNSVTSRTSSTITLMEIAG